MGNDTRFDLLIKLARNIEWHCATGQVVRRTSIALARAKLGKGLRVGCVDLYAGMESDRVFESLSRRDGALLRQMVPWKFGGSPTVSWAGKAIRVEIAWPDKLAVTRVPLSGLRLPTGHGGLEWNVGLPEFGGSMKAELNDGTPHWLVCGRTGTGKSVVLESLVTQFARMDDVLIVLVDAKGGQAIKRVERAHGVMGPVASDVVSIRAALGWVVRKMNERYGGAEDRRPIVTVVDELWDVVKDEKSNELVQLILSKGREAHCFLVAATQYPTVEALGGQQSARNFTGRIALQVNTTAASMTATGTGSVFPMANRLLGAGDLYLVRPSGEYTRGQAAFVDEKMTAPRWEWPMNDWPDCGREMPSRWPEADAVAHAVISAAQPRPEGRKRLEQRLIEAGLDVFHADWMQALTEYGRGIMSELGRAGVSVCLSLPGMELISAKNGI